MPSINRKTRAVSLLFPLLWLAACQTLPSPPAASDSAVLAEVPSQSARVSPDAARYLVDAQVSEVRILVYRDGPLARFGHNHVIVGRVRGEIHANERASASGFRLEVPVDSLDVDPAAARAEEGDDFAADVSEQARSATRDNMLGADVLDAAAHPRIVIDAIALAGPAWNPSVTARVTLRGATRAVRFPAALFRQGEALAVIASLRIRQTDFGIKPFAALNGGLLVRDAIDLRLRIVARRATA